MARQNGIDLADVTGHGPGGVITREDLAAHLTRGIRPAPAGRPSVRPGPPSGASRSTWPRRWSAAWPTAPQACVFLTVDATRDGTAGRAPPGQPALRRSPRDAARRGRPRRRPRPARPPRPELVVGRGDRRSRHQARTSIWASRGRLTRPGRAEHQGRAGSDVARADRGAGGADRACPCRTLHARRPARRDDHHHEHRCLR